LSSVLIPPSVPPLSTLSLHDALPISSESLSTVPCPPPPAESALECSGCGRAILDRYLYSVDATAYWHESCLQCAVCRIVLSHKCYLKARKLYCKHDYHR